MICPSSGLTLHFSFTAGKAPGTNLLNEHVGVDGNGA